MSLTQESKCNQCLEEFDADRTPFKMPNCLHNICSSCLHEIRADKLNVIHCEFCHNSISDCLGRKFHSNIKLKNIMATRSPRGFKKSDQGISPDSSFKKNPGSQTLEDGDLLLTE